jgi:hypothetical protein
MNKKELREIAKSVEEDDQIKIGRFEIPFSVRSPPGEDSEGYVHLIANRPNFPEEGVNTTIHMTVGAKGDDLLVSKEGIKDPSRDPVDMPNNIGKVIEETTHELEELSIV